MADPGARRLRRAALGVIRLVLENDLRFGLVTDAFSPAKAFLDRSGKVQRLVDELALEAEFRNFFADRLTVLLRDQGQRHDLVAAVFALGDDDLVRIVRRVEALAAFLATDDGANLLAGYKRASNILRAEEKKGPLPTGMVRTGLPNQPEEEVALAFAVGAARTAVETALDKEDFAAAMSALAGDEEFIMRPMKTALGEMTVGEALIRFHAFDLIVHRWDLARSQGVDARFTDAEIDCVEESLELFGDAAYTPGILGEPVPVADDADRQTRLLGRLGRRG